MLVVRPIHRLNATAVLFFTAFLLLLGAVRAIGQAEGGPVRNSLHRLVADGEPSPYRFHHNLWRIFTPDRYDESPEVFPLRNGVRFRPAERDRNWQPCLSHPRTAEIAAAVAKEYFAARPEEVSFSLGINDATHFCSCPDCEALIDRENLFRDLPDASDLVFTFMNRVAELLEDEYPEKFLGCLAYFKAENTPSFPVHPQVMPYLTADRTQYFDARFRAEDRALLERWTQAGPRQIGWYDYYYGGSFWIPRHFWKSMEESLSLAVEYGVTAMYVEWYPMVGWDLTKGEVWQRFLQDSTTTIGEHRQSVSEELYGSAADLVLAFEDLAEQVWEGRELGDLPGRAYWLRGYRRPYPILLWKEENLREAARLRQAMKERLPEMEGEEGLRLEQLRWAILNLLLYAEYFAMVWPGTEGGQGEWSEYEDLVWRALRSALDQRMARLENLPWIGGREVLRYWPLIADFPGRYVDARNWEPEPGRWPGSRGNPTENLFFNPSNRLAGVSWASREDPERGWLESWRPGVRGTVEVSADGKQLIVRGPGRPEFFFREIVAPDQPFVFTVQVSGRLSRGAAAELITYFFDREGRLLHPPDNIYRTGLSQIDDFQDILLVLADRTPEDTFWILPTLRVKELADGDEVRFAEPTFFSPE